MFADPNLTEGTHTWPSDSPHPEWTSTFTLTPHSDPNNPPYFDSMVEDVKDSGGALKFHQEISYNDGGDGLNWPSTLEWEGYENLDINTYNDYIKVVHTDYQFDPSGKPHSFKAYMNGLHEHTWITPDGGISVGQFRPNPSTRIHEFSEVVTWPSTHEAYGSRRESSGTFNENTRTGNGTFKFWMRKGGKLKHYEEGTWTFKEPQSPGPGARPYHHEEGTRTIYDSNEQAVCTETFSHTGYEDGRQEFEMTNNNGTPSDLSDDLRMVGSGQATATQFTFTHKSYLSYGTADTSDDYLLCEETMVIPITQGQEGPGGPRFPPPAGSTMTMIMYPPPDIPPDVPPDSFRRHTLQVEQTFQDPDASSGVCARGTLTDLSTGTLVASLTFKINGEVTMAFTDGTSLTFNVFEEGGKGGPPG